MEAIDYLEGVIEKLCTAKEMHPDEPILYIKMQIVTLKLENRDKKECNKLLDEEKSTLDGMTDIDPSVYASYYWISSQFHKFRQEFAEFYKSALLYMSYTDLAFDLSLSALLVENIYNFGELLAHQIGRGEPPYICNNGVYIPRIAC